MPVEQQAQAVYRNREDGELLGLPQPSVPALRRITDAVLADIADDRPGGMGAGGRHCAPHAGETLRQDELRLAE
jgi:hypothetical protein